MGLPGQVKIEQVRDGLAGTRLGQFAPPAVSTQDLDDLEVEQVRDVQRLGGTEDASRDLLGRGGRKKKLEKRRRVDDDHRASRSARIASAGEGWSRTDVRAFSRSRSSSSVGRWASRRICSRRYSESDVPASAARAFSVLWRLSGTFRIWIIRDMRGA